MPKLNTGIAAAPILISSSAFRIGTDPNITMIIGMYNSPTIYLTGTGSATINRDDGPAPETVTLTSTLTTVEFVPF